MLHKGCLFHLICSHLPFGFRLPRGPPLWSCPSSVAIAATDLGPHHCCRNFHTLEVWNNTDLLYLWDGRNLSGSWGAVIRPPAFPLEAPSPVFPPTHL